MGWDTVNIFVRMGLRYGLQNFCYTANLYFAMLIFINQRIVCVASRLQIVRFYYKCCILLANRAFDFTNLRSVYDCCVSSFKC